MMLGARTALWSGGESKEETMYKELYINLIERNKSDEPEFFFPNGLTKIGQYAYAGALPITDRLMVIPEGVISIGDHALESNIAKGMIRNLSVPNSCNRIGERAFDGFNYYGFNIKFEDGDNTNPLVLGQNLCQNTNGGNVTLEFPNRPLETSSSMLVGHKFYNRKIIFHGKTFNDVKSLKGFPFGMTNAKEARIVCEDGEYVYSSGEWVKQ